MEAILSVWLMKDGTIITMNGNHLFSFMDGHELLGFVQGHWDGAIGKEPFHVSEIFANMTAKAIAIHEYFSAE